MVPILLLKKRALKEIVLPNAICAVHPNLLWWDGSIYIVQYGRH